MENTAVEVIEEVAGATLNKAVIIGTVVAGGALVLVLAPKAYRKVKKLFAKLSKKAPTQEDTVVAE